MFMMLGCKYGQSDRAFYGGFMFCTEIVGKHEVCNPPIPRFLRASYCIGITINGRQQWFRGLDVDQMHVFSQVASDNGYPFIVNQEQS